MKKTDRIEWIDYTKAFACLLVAVGHLLMSLRSIDIYSNITNYVVWFIYLFHMPLFMCLSGILYYKRTRINSFNEYKNFEFKKIINLLIPYVTFYSITMALNMMFSNSVNTPKGVNEWLGIFNNPISPYWFLYALLSIFIVVPIIEKILNQKKENVMIFFVVLKVLSIFYCSKVYFVKSIMQQGIYFYFGTYLVDKRSNKKNIFIFLLSLFYILISFLIYSKREIMNEYVLEMVYIGFAMVGTIIVINIFQALNKSKILDSFKKYTFQIFLMHTIFAAGIRIIMFKIGIYNYFVHLIIGLIFSIYMPVLVSIISNKLKYTNFFFYPLKTIEGYKKG